jgi:alkylation response protein AidB-like acyl-CoA dehydrogenase
VSVDIELGPTALAFRTEVRAWLAAHAPAELTGVDVDNATADQTGLLDQWAEEIHRAGYMCVTWPVQYGGRGLSRVESAVLDEEFAHAGVPRMTRGVGEWLVAPAILQWGTAEQKARFLPRIADGTDRYCQGFSEPGSGSDLASLTTAGLVDGEELVIRGQKVWTSGAERASMLFCLCRTDTEAPRHRGISYVLVPMFTADGASNGIELRPIRQIDGDADFTATFLDDARAPLGNVIGGLNNGWRVTMTTLGSERAGGSPVQHIPFARQFWQAVDIARSRGLTGDARVRQELAWAFTHVEIMRYQGLAAFSDAVAGREPGPRASIHKMFWSQYSQRFLDRVANLRGPQAMLLPDQPADGYEPDDWTLALLRSRGSTIWGGTAEIQRNIVGERLLGLPRDS